MNIPGYRVEELIGQGGMASVYRAVQESLARPVALKLLTSPQNPEFSRRFLNEGRIIASLRHSNVIAIYDLGIVGNCHYISMEYLDGGDLDARIERGLKAGAAVTILEQLAGCLHFVHEQGIVHRDVKPANILFRSDGTPVLTDFGIAKELEAKAKLTATGAALGTPYYLSPEQLQGAPVTRSADIYSLGIVFYEMLTGHVPYQGDSYAVVLTKHLQASLPELPTRLARLQPLLNRMLAKDPKDRFRSADELVHAVQELRRSPRSRPSVPGAGGMPAGRGDASVLGKRSAAKGSAIPKRARLWAAATGTALLVLTAVTTALMVRTLDGQVAVAKRQVAAPPEARAVEEPVNLSVENPGAGIAPLAQAPDLVAAANPAPAEQGAAKPVRAPEERVEDLPQEARTGVPPVQERTPREGRAAMRNTVGSAEPIAESAHGEERSRPIADSEEIVPEAQTEQDARVGQGWVEEPLSPPVRARIEELLTRGESCLGDFRLTSPPGDNAYHYYRQVLEMDPTNRRAQQGMVDIATGYYRLARGEIDGHRYASARVYIDRGLFVQPGDRRLLALRQEIGESRDRDYAGETSNVIRDASAQLFEKSRQALRRMRSLLP